MKFFGVLGIAAAIVLLPHFAFAQPEEENVQPVRLSYAANSDCPSKDDFVQAIRARGLSIRESDDAPRAMSVTLAPDLQSGQWHGTLHVHDAHGDASRDVSAGSCTEVAHSIALFASLALTPEADAPTPPPLPPTPLPVRLPTPIPAKKKPDRAIPKRPIVVPYSLSRHRYSIEPEMIFHLSSQMFEDFGGIGVVGTYRFSDRFGLGLSADLLHSFDDYPNAVLVLPTGASPQASPQASSDVALLRVMARAPISIHAARGTFDGRAGSPFDFFLRPQIGTILTKPNNLPPQVSEAYSPSFAVELDFGARAFITPDFAITASVGFLSYEERYAQASYLFNGQGYLREATYHWSYYANFGPLFQLGAEFELPGAPASR